MAADGQPYPAGHGRAWAVSERTVRRYLARGDKLLEQMAGERREASFNRFLVQRRQLYNRALAMGDVRAALAASDSEAKLLGLFDPKAAPPPTTGDVTTCSDDQLESVIRGHDFTRPGESPRPPTAKPQAFDTGPGI